MQSSKQIITKDKTIEMVCSTVFTMKISVIELMEHYMHNCNTLHFCNVMQYSSLHLICDDFSLLSLSISRENCCFHLINAF